MARKRTQTDPPDTGDEPAGEVFPTSVAPDVGIEVTPCLAASLAEPLKQALTDALRPQFPHVDIRATCVHGSERIGVWTTPSTSDLSSQDRDLGLGEISVLTSAERDKPDSFGIAVNASAVWTMAYGAWDRAPKRLNETTFAPDPAGSIHLTGFDPQLRSPDRLEVVITGKAVKDLADIDFTLTTTDTLRIADARVRCSTKNHLDVDHSFFDDLIGILSVFIPVPVAFAVVAQLFPSTPDERASSIGTAVVATFPREILVPNTPAKLVFSYDRVAVSQRGVEAAGTYAAAPRKPRVHITGDTTVSSIEGLAAHARLIAVTRDMRGPLQVTWRAAGGTVLHGLAEATSVTFPGSGGATTSHDVSVSVKDADGAARSAHVTVYVNPTADPGDRPNPAVRLDR